MRGGGVGFYIRKGLNFKILKELEIFQQKTFENMVIEVHYQNRHFILSNIYHSPNPPSNTTTHTHNSNFLEKLDTHLCSLSNTNKDAYVFLDANIDLLKLNESNLSQNYMDVNITNGFIQLTCKATRIQSTTYSLIDHILTNTNLPSYCNGTILADISDHFINFLQLPITKLKQTSKPTFSRKFSDENVLRFKNALGAYLGKKSTMKMMLTVHLTNFGHLFLIFTT